jgi:predicted O-methyltransferase YrrM/SAM-dependent methyltransferase
MMGTSNWQHLPYCIDVLMAVNPRRVLDVGVGFGRWGAMTREFCELWQERVLPNSWLVRVEGIEAFPGQLGDWQRSLYNQIHIGDARKLLPKLPGDRDLIIFGDVLEHFEKSEARELLNLCLDKSEYILINIPIGAGYDQTERYGNPYEAHLSLWETADFQTPFARSSRLGLDSFGRTYLSVVLSRNDPKKLGESLGLQWDLDPEAIRLAEGRKRLLESAAACRQRAHDPVIALAEAQRSNRELRQQMALMHGHITVIEASLTWRLMKFGQRTGLLAVPYAIVQGYRRMMNSLRSGPAAAVASAGPGQIGAAEDSGFNVPVPVTSEAFVDLLKLRPDSFKRVYEAPALMSPQERVLLYGVTFGLAPRRYLEIGTCRGGSAVVVAAAMDDLNNGRAFGVDPQANISPQILQQIKHRFTLVQGSSPQALKRAAELAGGRFDLILVDGDHSRAATLADLDGVLSVAEPGAVILVHDAYNDAVDRAVADYLASQNGRVIDGGILATSRNSVVEADGPRDWGGLRLLRVSASGNGKGKNA